MISLESVEFHKNSQKFDLFWNGAQLFSNFFIDEQHNFSHK